MSDTNELRLHLADAKKRLHAAADLRTEFSVNNHLSQLHCLAECLFNALVEASDRIEALEKLTAPCPICMGTGVSRTNSQYEHCQTCGGSGFKRRLP